MSSVTAFNSNGISGVQQLLEGMKSSYAFTCRLTNSLVVVFSVVPGRVVEVLPSFPPLLHPPLHYHRPLLTPASSPSLLPGLLTPTPPLHPAQRSYRHSHHPTAFKCRQWLSHLSHTVLRTFLLLLSVSSGDRIHGRLLAI